jgi:hypothetical protein
MALLARESVCLISSERHQSEVRKTCCAADAVEENARSGLFGGVRCQLNAAGKTLYSVLRQPTPEKKALRR